MVSSIFAAVSGPGFKVGVINFILGYKLIVVNYFSIDEQLPKLSFLWNGEDIPSIISTNGSILSIPQSGYYSNFLRVCESVQNIGPLSLSISSFID